MTNNLYDGKILNAIMDAAVDAIVVSDDKGRILKANPAAHRLFGYDAESLVGLNVKILMPQEMARQHDSFMKSYIDTGEKKIIGIGREVEGLRANGRGFPLRLSVGEAAMDDTPVFVGILHDLTQHRANENALARTLRLDAIGQMTGGISHDFNNLLTVIIGNLELAEMRNSDEKVSGNLQNAMEAAEMGADLTSRLMMFARKSPLRPEASDLGKICYRTLDLLKRTLGANYEISADCPKNLALVLVDPVQMESALVNLAINARDAMPEGGNLLFQISEIEIDDTYMAQEADVVQGNYVRLLVSDDGKGMTPETQTRAFEPFYTTKADKNGTGLGLAMVYGFVKQSGGHITLYSEVGHGTSFGLYFPALQQGTHPDGPIFQTGSEVPLGNGECILVVEDNPRVRRISVERLHALNYRTKEAGSGDEAYRILQQDNEVDLVFSDIVMPGAMNGYDLAICVRTEFPSIKFLLTSGYASDVVTGKMRSSDRSEILHKPYHQLNLAKRLSTLLNNAKPG